MSKQPPSAIYLQWFDPADCRCDSECTEGGEGEVTWCEDRQHDADVKYVLESVLKERDEELHRLRLYLQDTSEGFEHIESCDSNGCDGEGGCPVTNIPAAFPNSEGKTQGTRHMHCGIGSGSHSREGEGEK